MSPTVNVLTKTFLSALLMLGGLAGAAGSDFYRKSLHRDTTLQSSNDGRHAVRKQPRQQTKSEVLRSLDLESFNVHVTPSTSKISLPNIIRLYPPTAKPLHLEANLPMRFGRESIPDDDRDPNSTPNMPQRFGRSWEVIRMCAECPDVQEAPRPAMGRSFGRRRPYWSLLNTLVNAQLLNTDLHWTEHFDFTSSSEEVEIEEKTFRG